MESESCKIRPQVISLLVIFSLKCQRSERSNTWAHFRERAAESSLSSLQLAPVAECSLRLNPVLPGTVIYLSFIQVQSNNQLFVVCWPYLGNKCPLKPRCHFPPQMDSGRKYHKMLVDHGIRTMRDHSSDAIMGKTGLIWENELIFYQSKQSKVMRNKIL